MKSFSEFIAESKVQAAEAKIPAHILSRMKKAITPFIEGPVSVDKQGSIVYQFYGKNLQDVLLALRDQFQDFTTTPDKYVHEVGGVKMSINRPEPTEDAIFNQLIITKGLE